MSRIIVKNLPRHTSEKRFHEVFSSQGDITDSRLVYTAAGKFRGFGFVGFRRAEDAQSAVDHFNKSFLDTSRLQVELAKLPGDQSLPRPWSRHTAGSSAHKQATKEKQKSEDAAGSQEDDDDDVESKKKKKKPKKTAATFLKEAVGVDEDDPQFQEFLALYQRGEKGKTWSNDTVLGDLRGLPKKKTENKRAGAEEGSVKRRKKRRAHSDSESDDSSGSDDAGTRGAENMEDSSSDVEDVVPQKAADDVAMSTKSDLDYLRSKMTRGAATESTDEEESSEDEKTKTRHQVATTEEHSSSSSSSSSDEDDEDDGHAAKPAAKGTAFTVKMTGLPFKAKEGAVYNFFTPLKIEGVRMPLDQMGRPSGIAFVDFARAADVQKALRRNKKRINGRYIELTTERNLQEMKQRRDDGKMKALKSQAKWDWIQSTKDEPVESIAESGRLFVTNLTYGVTEEELTPLFEAHGPVSELVMPVDKKTKKQKGVAIVTYLMPEHAVTALNQLDGTHFQGRVLHIQPAKAKLEPTEQELTEKSSYKKKKEAAMKASAVHWTNWNTLFLGADTVAEGIAAKFGTTKADVLDAESSKSQAVRLALGETDLVKETKDFLIQHGVQLDTLLRKAVKRSSSIILVKDLPHGTTASQLRKLFTPFGDLVRVVLPPSGVSGLVELSDAVEARAAYKKLYGSKYVDRPLFLEWAPEGVFKGPPPAADAADEDSDKENEDGADAAADAGTGPQQQSTLFIKNLNFATTEDTLRDIFDSVGPIQTLTIAKKKDPKNPGQTLSLGFGFVEFKQREHAIEAIKNLQKHTIDGHSIELKISDRTTKVVGKASKRSKGTAPPSSKILVRNLPFEANQKEIRELFMAYGQIKSVRLPKKPGSKDHRGFGFVEFLSKQEAERAFEALSASTHFYGRRLVLEWAMQDESVDSVRMRTAKYYQEPLAKRKKVELDRE